MDDRHELPRRVVLGPGEEFDLIRRLVADEGPSTSAVLVGPGDDAAVFEGGWVLSSDLTVEDVHFRREWLTDLEVGYRAAAAALSDLAAMGARAVAVLVSLAMPSPGRFDIELVQAGVREAAAAAGAPVVGGDLSRSPGPLVLDVVVVGRADAPILRAGSRAGDELWVTGTLGAPAAAVRLWKRGEEPDRELREAYVHPHPRIAEACFLAERSELHALVDLSDGLAGDAGHVSAAGGIRLVLDPGRLPLSSAARKALGDVDARSLALHGGEDYELLLVAAPGSVDADAFSRRFGLALTRVGRVEEGEGVWVVEAGRERPVDRGGYSHVEGGV